MKNLWLVSFFVVALVIFGSSGGAASGGSHTIFTGDLNSLLPNEVGDSDVSAIPDDVEGVTIDHQRSARLKPGYTFRRESRASVSVWKTVREAAMQMGTLTCTKSQKGACTLDIGGDTAKCSSGCYFVGVRGGTRVQ